MSHINSHQASSSLSYRTVTGTGLYCKKLMRLVGISSWSMQWILLIFLRYLRTASRHCEVKAFGFPGETGNERKKVIAWVTQNKSTVLYLTRSVENIFFCGCLMSQFKYCSNTMSILTAVLLHL